MVSNIRVATKGFLAPGYKIGIICSCLNPKDLNSSLATFIVFMTVASLVLVFATSPKEVSPAARYLVVAVMAFWLTKLVLLVVSRKLRMWPHAIAAG